MSRSPRVNREAGRRSTRTRDALPVPARGAFELVFLDLLAERVAVDAQVLGRLREVAAVPLQHAGDEPLLELAARVHEEDPLVHHLRDQRLELLLHGNAPSFRLRATLSRGRSA